MFNQVKSNKGVLLRHEPSRVHWLGDLLHLPAAKGIKTPQKIHITLKNSKFCKHYELKIGPIMTISEGNYSTKKFVEFFMKNGLLTILEEFKCP